MPPGGDVPAWGIEEHPVPKIFRNLMKRLGISREGEKSVPAASGESERTKGTDTAGQTHESADEISRYFEETTNNSMSLHRLVSAQAEAEDIDDAIETAKGIGSSLFYAAALMKIGIAQAQAGHIQGAIETIRRIDDPEDCAEVLKHFSYIKNMASPETIDDLIRVSMEGIREIRDDEDSARTSWETATSLAGKGDFTAAVQAARDIADPFWRSWTLQEIATAQALAGRFAAALKCAGGIGQPIYRSWAYKDIATAQVEAGQIDAALDTARRIEDPEHRAEATAAIEKLKEQRGE